MHIRSWTQDKTLLSPQDAVTFIIEDDDVGLKKVLKKGLYVDAVYHNIELSGYPMGPESTLIHWTATYDAKKCAKVRRKNDNHRHRTHFPCLSCLALS